MLLLLWGLCTHACVCVCLHVFILQSALPLLLFSGSDNVITRLLPLLLSNFSLRSVESSSEIAPVSSNLRSACCCAFSDTLRSPAGLSQAKSRPLTMSLPYWALSSGSLFSLASQPSSGLSTFDCSQVSDRHKMLTSSCIPLCSLPPFQQCFSCKNLLCLCSCCSHLPPGLPVRMSSLQPSV